MKAGLLDRRITFENPTESQNDVGEPVKTWAVFKTVSCSIVPQRENEFMANDEISAEAALTFRCRFFVGLKNTMRIRYEQKYFDIKGFKEIGRREGLEITATTRQP